jgi:16S rRNA C967 or C1407 C5-methylase (RsmB/RsmF family)/NOL1/NOP2/fmu family ribosome biogenesis protein
VLPIKLLESLEGIIGFEKEAFIDVHTSGEQITSVRFNPLKSDAALQQNIFTENLGKKIPWSGSGHYLNERPSFTFDPLFHAGCYYVQEASSMFLEEAMRQTVDLSQHIHVLDLCAAPGGKSTLIHSIITKDSLLVSNEVIRTRVNILTENLIKWGAENVVVTQNDPKSFQKLEGFFDVVVIDAPCSGSGLFRRDHEAINEWSLNNVELCSQRQQRIIADVWDALKPGGMLIYSTCSFSKEEDEEILDWIVEDLGASSKKIRTEDSWGITEVLSERREAFGYRFWPDKVDGEGFFISCFQKNDGSEFSYDKKKKEHKQAQKNIPVFQKYLKDVDLFSFIEKENSWYAIPKQLSEAFDAVLGKMNIVHFGIEMGQVIKDELIPAHSLALSLHIRDELQSVDLEKMDALHYLGRRDLKIETELIGWTIARYEGKNLGWMKVLKNRINNYYPKEWRILKDPTLLKNV